MQIRTIEDQGKRLVESSELIKKDFYITRDSVPISNELVEKIF